MKPLKVHCIHRFASGVTLDAAFETDAQVTALVGPSGAGKTSLLYMIAGLLRPNSGEIRFGDQQWLDTRRGICASARQRHVGFVFQDHLLFPHLSVERNLLYGYRRRGLGGAIQPARVIEVLELGPLVGRYPRNLSGGEKQRVALGRALLSGPQLLVMDEPLAALDAALKERILSYFQRVLAEWNVPTIYVSHSLPEVRRLATRVVIIEGGNVVVSSSSEELFRDSRGSS